MIHLIIGHIARTIESAMMMIGLAIGMLVLFSMVMILVEGNSNDCTPVMVHKTLLNFFSHLRLGGFKRTLRNKADSVIDNTLAHNIDALAIIETWLRPDDDLVASRCLFIASPGPSERTRGPYGGIAILSLSREELEELANYRPASILNFISKVLEKVVAALLTGHMNAHQLLEPLQSAYRKMHITETALTEVFDDIAAA